MQIWAKIKNTDEAFRLGFVCLLKPAGRDISNQAKYYEQEEKKSCCCEMNYTVQNQHTAFYMSQSSFKRLFKHCSCQCRLIDGRESLFQSIIRTVPWQCRVFCFNRQAAPPRFPADSVLQIFALQVQMLAKLVCLVFCFSDMTT